MRIKENIKKIINIFGYPIRYYQRKKRKSLDSERIGIDLLDFHFSPPKTRLEMKKYLKILSKLNASWVRLSFDWYSYQKYKNKYFFMFDHLVDGLIKNKIKILGVICNVVPGNLANFFFGPPKKFFPAPFDHKEKFLDFTAETVFHFKDKIKFWEFMNEPDTKRHWVNNPAPKIYTKMLKETYSIVKTIDNTLSVVSGGIAGMSLNGNIDYFDNSYLRGLVKEGFAKYCDLVAIHPYTFSSYLSLNPNPIFYMKEAIKKTKKMVRFIKKAKIEHNIWVTEFGINPMWTFLDHYEVSNIYYSIIKKLINLKKLEKIFLFNFRDFPNRNYEFFNPDPYFGLVTGDYKIKESARFLIKRR